MDLFTLKGKLAEVTEAFNKANETYMERLSSATSDAEENATLKAQRDDLKTRVDEISGEVARMESAAKARLEAQAKSEPTTEAGKHIKAKAAVYRKMLTGQPLDKDEKAILNTALTAIPASGGTGGEDLLPTNTDSDLIHEPFATNPMRDIVRVSGIVGLEIPRITYSIDDDAYIADTASAKEMEAVGDTVSFGRFKSKIFCDISETVVNGSDVQLVADVENALRSGLAAKEKKVMFAAADDQTVGEEHMSFYQEDASGNTVITTATGADTYAAIQAALDDLHEDYRANARIVMKRSDYTAMLTDLANGNAAFFTAPPESVLGYPVVFCDSATTPIVGDFNYCQINYEQGATFENDKNVKTGMLTFVLTAQYDIQRRLNSAFRLAGVVEEVS